MENESNATASGNAGHNSSWEGSSVIVLPAESAAARPKSQQQCGATRPQQREKEQQQQPGAELVPEPPAKVFYKTRLCERFESGGWCAYEEACTFAHGRAELRPPLPLPPTFRRSRPAPPPPADADDSWRATFLYVGAGKVCFEFRDKGTCRYGDKCNYAHGTAAVQPTDTVYHTGPDPARKSATSPARAFSPGSCIYAPATTRAFPPAHDVVDGPQGEVKPTPLELLSRKKLSGIYGDWPEDF